MVMDLERTFGIAGIITGALFIVGSIGFIFLLMFFDGIISTISGFLAQAAGLGIGSSQLAPISSMLSSASNLMMLGWIYAIIELVSGIVWIVVGSMCLAEKE